jgi:phospholipid transport system substrate-binding protein
MKIIRLSGVLVGLCLIVSPVYAGEPADLVKSLLDRAYQLVTDTELGKTAKIQERAARIVELKLSVVDLEEMGRQALRDHWEERTAVERKQYLDLFSFIMKRSMTPNPPEGEEWAKSVIDGEKIDGEFAEVEAHFIMRVARDIPTTYRLRRTNGAWKLYDWGSFARSFIANYRAQYNRVIANSSFDGLLTALRQKKELIEKKIAAGDPLLVPPFGR